MKIKDKMFRMVENWNQSSLSKEDFLRGTGVRVGKFGYWISKYNKQDKVKVPVAKIEAPSFQRILLSPPTIKERPDKKIIELTTSSGVQISIFE